MRYGDLQVGDVLVTSSDLVDQHAFVITGKGSVKGSWDVLRLYNTRGMAMAILRNWLGWSWNLPSEYTVYRGDQIIRHAGSLDPETR